MKSQAIGTFILLGALVLVLAACEPRAEQAAPDQQTEPTQTKHNEVLL